MNSSKYNLNNTTMPTPTQFSTLLEFTMDVRNQSLFLIDEFGLPMFGKDIYIEINGDEKWLAKNNSIFFKPLAWGS